MGKKTMVGAWSDNDSSVSEDGEDIVANLYFIENGKELEDKFELLRYCKSELEEVKGTLTQQVKSLVLKCLKTI